MQCHESCLADKNIYIVCKVHWHTRLLLQLQVSMLHLKDWVLHLQDSMLHWQNLMLHLQDSMLHWQNSVPYLEDSNFHLQDSVLTICSASLTEFYASLARIIQNCLSSSASVSFLLFFPSTSGVNGNRWGEGWRGTCFSWQHSHWLVLVLCCIVHCYLFLHLALVLFVYL